MVGKRGTSHDDDDDEDVGFYWRSRLQSECGFLPLGFLRTQDQDAQTCPNIIVVNIIIIIIIIIVIQTQDPDSHTCTIIILTLIITMLSIS